MGINAVLNRAISQAAKRRKKKRKANLQVHHVINCGEKHNPNYDNGQMITEILDDLLISHLHFYTIGIPLTQL